MSRTTDRPHYATLNAELRHDLQTAMTEIGRMQVAMRRMEESFSRDVLFKEIGKLREEVAQRDAEIRRLRGVLAGPGEFPREWGLTAGETLVLKRLALTAGVVPYPALCEAARLKARGDAVSDDNIKVRIYCLRRKVPNLVLYNQHNIGYELSKTSRARLLEVLAQVSPAEPCTPTDQ